MSSLAKNQPFVSVIIPCRNEEKFISKCLDSLLANDYPKDRLEILIVDGLSADKTREIVQSYSIKFPFIKLLSNTDKIVPSSMNVGIKKALGDFIVRIDAHTEYNSDYISKCLEKLISLGVDCVGGPMRVRGKNTISWAIAYAYETFLGLGGGKFHNENYEGDVDTVYLGAWPKKLFDKIGLFDERMVRNQDDELSFRIKKNGGKIYQSPEIKSFYYPRASLKSLWKQYYQYGFWKPLIIKKHHQPATLRQFIPGLFVLSLILTFIFGFLCPLFQGLFRSIISLYLLVIILVSLKIALKHGLKYLFIVPVIFAILHFAYGLGYLRGLIRNFIP